MWSSSSRWGTKREVYFQLYVSQRVGHIPAPVDLSDQCTTTASQRFGVKCAGLSLLPTHYQWYFYTPLGEGGNFVFFQFLRFLMQICSSSMFTPPPPNICPYPHPPQFQIPRNNTAHYGTTQTSYGPSQTTWWTHPGFLIKMIHPRKIRCSPALESWNPLPIIYVAPMLGGEWH